MAKDTRDTHTLDAFPAKPSRGRPRKADALSNAERQRLYRQRQAGKAPRWTRMPWSVCRTNSTGT
ncbi:hypothetical protein CDL16_17640 [Pseudomonas aeruginosa]|nr:hypothetical protein CDL16_17640 [Pseudomonas aeruginosa]